MVVGYQSMFLHEMMVHSAGAVGDIQRVSTQAEVTVAKSTSC